MIEATKGINSYYLTSDKSTMSYRTRIRTPSFPHLQQIPSVIRGSMVPDLIALSGQYRFCDGGCGPLIEAKQMIICTETPSFEPYELTEAERTEIEHHMAHYEDPRAATIDALKIDPEGIVAGCPMAPLTRSPNCSAFLPAMWKGSPPSTARSSASRWVATSFGSATAWSATSTGYET